MILKTPALILVLIVFGTVFSGCTGSTRTAPQTTIITRDTITPLTTTTLVTPLPFHEYARIKINHFGMNPSTETVYDCVGTVQVKNGVYRSVQVILHYPDGQEYSYDVGGMGGANQTLKPFYLYPADRYKATNPEKIIALDGERYTMISLYENVFIAWSS